MLRRLLNYFEGRSSKWPALRKEWLMDYPCCAVCGGTKKLEVHHILPVHLFPYYELEPTNLITLCESKNHGVNCHLFVGHLGDYSRYNPDVRKDSCYWDNKLR